jgi:hypothetical protein
MPDVVTDDMVNTLISFESKHAADPVVWTGTVVAIGTWHVARTYSDLTSYHAAVLQADDTIDADYKEMNYFLIRLDEVEGQPIKAFASEWIAEGTLEAIDQRVKVIIEFYDLNTNTQADMIAALQEYGARNIRVIQADY